MQIDAVITWVDGNDPVHRARRLSYLGGDGLTGKVDPAGTSAVRFDQADEIRICLRSIHNHAPWIKRIWLITDNQFPASIDRTAAEAWGLRVVDHTELFAGYEEFLPTFNSLSIETMMWRIPGLSDKFLYFNDDMFLSGPIGPEHVVSSDEYVKVRGRWVDWRKKKLSHYRVGLVRGAQLLGYDRSKLYYNAHTAYPMSRTALEDFFKEHPEEFLSNAAFRFRDAQQFSVISAHNHYLARQRKIAYSSRHATTHIRRTSYYTEAALRNKLISLSYDGRLFACVNFLTDIIRMIPDALSYLESAAGPRAPFEKDVPA